jgi:hypothetical protein
MAGEGGASELDPEVRVPIWGIGGGGAHRGGLTPAKQVGGGEPATVGRRRGGELRLRVHGAAVSSGEGRCGDGGARQWPEMTLDGKAASATEGGGRLGASMVSCNRRWISGQLGVAQRHTRMVRGGRRFSAWSTAMREQRQTARAERSGRCSVAVVGREETMSCVVRGAGDARGGGCMCRARSGCGGWLAAPA